MAITDRQRSLDETARLGTDLLERLIFPSLRPEDGGRFVAVDVNTGEYEVDDDDYTAARRLHERVAGADVWIGMAGELAAYRTGLR